MSPMMPQGTVKILIAEDDSFFRHFLHQLLASDCEVVIVADGDAAWDCLQATEGPVLAILDWVMPGMAGPEICRAARQRQDGGHISDSANRKTQLSRYSRRLALGRRRLRDQAVQARGIARPGAIGAKNHPAGAVAGGAESCAGEYPRAGSIPAEPLGRSREQWAGNNRTRTAAGAGYSGSLDTLTAKAEFSAGNTPTPTFPVNHSKVS